MRRLKGYMALFLSFLLLAFSTWSDYYGQFNPVRYSECLNGSPTGFIANNKINTEVPFNQPESVTAKVNNLPVVSHLRKVAFDLFPGISSAEKPSSGSFRSYAYYPEVVCLNFTSRDIIFPFHNFF